MCYKYNGYDNYQTWATSLWLDNEPYTNEWLYNLANSSGNNDDRDCITDRTYQLEDFAKEVFFNAYTENADASLHMDLLQHAIGAVNWRQILRSHMEFDYDDHVEAEAQAQL